MSSKIETLYTDSAKTNAIYPRTKVSAISDDEGKPLSDVISEINTAITNAGKFYGIDTTNILQSSGGAATLTAEYDGILVWKNNANGHGRLWIDGVWVDSAVEGQYSCTPIKKGQVALNTRSTDNGAMGMSGTIYGLKE